MTLGQTSAAHRFDHSKRQVSNFEAAPTRVARHHTFVNEENEMTEMVQVLHTIDGADEDGQIMAGCSCSCSGPNVTVVNTGSKSAHAESRTITILKNKAADQRT
jgi:hypothetical protein